MDISLIDKDKSTFFFRKGEYSAKEMTKRIFSEDIIEEFKGYSSEGASPTKKGCLVGLYEANQENEETYREKIKHAFIKKGRRGDNMSLHLYRLLIDSLNISYEVESSIASICSSGQNLKLSGSLSNGINYDLYIDDLFINETRTILDIRFKSVTNDVIADPYPIFKERETFIETRLYVNSGIVALYNSSDNESIEKDILSILFYFFQRHSKRYEKVKLDESQLMMTKLSMNGEVLSPKYRSEDPDNAFRLDMYGVTPEHEGHEVVKFIGDSHLSMYEFSINCVIEGYNCRLRITEDGGLFISTPVSPKVLDAIVSILSWVILKEDYYEGTDRTISKLMRTKKPSVLEYKITQKIENVSNNIRELIAQNGGSDQERRLFITVLVNISFMMISEGYIYAIKENYSELEDNENVGKKNFRALIVDYCVFYENIQSDEALEYAELLLKFLVHILLPSAVNVVKLIVNFEDMQKEWSQCLAERTS
ncbi:hypothetical protein [Halobacillus sp. H74]|uniref:hypothetical protein n=1 Tax=Halobacillus sp. H74 TaxID=3457436 RepID=UPI003FCC454E